MDDEIKSQNLLNSAFPAIWRGKPSPRAYRVRPYPFQRGTPPQRPRRGSQACREIESAYPACSSLAPTTAPSNSLRRIPENRDRRGIPARPSAVKLPAGSLGGGSRAPRSASAYRRPPCWGRRCLRGYHGLPATKRCPRHFALWRRGRVPDLALRRRQLLTGHGLPAGRVSPRHRTEVAVCWRPPMASLCPPC